MQKAFNLVPGNYYAVYNGTDRYNDVYYICEGPDIDYRIFGLKPPYEILDMLRGGPAWYAPNPDHFYTVKHKTRIFESLDFHPTIANGAHFNELCTKMKKNNEYVKQGKEINEKMAMDRKREKENKEILGIGAVVGRYYSIPAGRDKFINAYLICTEKDNEKKLVFGLESPTAIIEILESCGSDIYATDKIASRFNNLIYTRTENRASEAKSADFKTMRNLLMDKLGFPETDAQRNFEIKDDDEFRETYSPGNSTPASIESEPDSKPVEALKKLNDILKNLKESLDSIQEELNS
jgi:hypothetical protein